MIKQSKLGARNAIPKDMLDVSLIAKWISKRSSIWQIRFLSLDDHCRFAREIEAQAFGAWMVTLNGSGK